MSMTPSQRDENDQQVADNVRQYGCHVYSVGASDDESTPAFTYSIGLCLPDVIVLGVRASLGKGMVDAYQEFALKGRRFEPGERDAGFLGGGFEVYVEPLANGPSPASCWAAFATTAIGRPDRANRLSDGRWGLALGAGCVGPLRQRSADVGQVAARRALNFPGRQGCSAVDPCPNLRSPRRGRHLSMGCLRSLPPVIHPHHFGALAHKARGASDFPSGIHHGLGCARETSPLQFF